MKWIDLEIGSQRSRKASSDNNEGIWRYPRDQGYTLVKKYCSTVRRSEYIGVFPKFPTQVPKFDGWAGSQISILYMFSSQTRLLPRQLDVIEHDENIFDTQKLFCCTVMRINISRLDILSAEPYFDSTFKIIFHTMFSILTSIRISQKGFEYPKMFSSCSTASKLTRS